MDDNYSTGSGRGKFTFQHHMYVTEITGWDVLLGRGSGPNVHEGNIRFRNHVALRKDEYMNTKHRNNKSKIAKEVALWVFSNNGRFVKKLEPEEARDNGLITLHDIELTATNPDYILPTFYELVDDETIMEKAKQSLRQLEKKIHRTSGSSTAKSSDLSIASDVGGANSSGPPSEQVQAQPLRRMTAPADLLKNATVSSMNFQQLGVFNEVDEEANEEENHNAMLATLFSQMSSPFNKIHRQQQLFPDNEVSGVARRITVSIPNDPSLATFRDASQNHNTRANHVGFDAQPNVRGSYQSNQHPITSISTGQTSASSFSNQQAQVSANVNAFSAPDERWMREHRSGDQFGNGNNTYSSNNFMDQSSGLHMTSMKPQQEKISQNAASFNLGTQMRNFSSSQPQTQQIQHHGSIDTVSDNDLVNYVNNFSRLQQAAQEQNTQQPLQTNIPENVQLPRNVISFFSEVQNQKSQDHIAQTIQSMNAHYSYHSDNQHGFGDPALREVTSQNPCLTSVISAETSDEVRSYSVNGSQRPSSSQQQGLTEKIDTKLGTRSASQEPQNGTSATYLQRIHQQQEQAPISNANKALKTSGQHGLPSFQDAYRQQSSYSQDNSTQQPLDQNVQSQHQIPDSQVSQPGVSLGIKQANQKPNLEKDTSEQHQTSRGDDQQAEDDMLAYVQGLNPGQARQLRNGNEYGNDAPPMPFQKRRNSLISGRRGSMTGMANRRGSMTSRRGSLTHKAGRRGSMQSVTMEDHGYSRRGSMTHKAGRRGSMQSVTMEDYGYGSSDYLLDDLLETFSYMSTDGHSHRYAHQRERIEQHRRMSVMTTGETVGTIDQYGQDDMSFGTIESNVFSEGDADAYEYLDDMPTRMPMLGMDFRGGGVSGVALDSSSKAQNEDYEYGDRAGVSNYFGYDDGHDADPIARRSINSITDTSWHLEGVNLPPVQERGGAQTDDKDSVDSSDSFNELIAEVRHQVDSKIPNPSS